MPTFHTTQNKNKKSKKKGEGRVRQLELKDEGQEYGLVLKLFGGKNAEVQLQKGGNKMCSLSHMKRGNARVQVGDIILVNLRSFQANRADAVYKYLPDEVNKLKQQGEISFKNVDPSLNQREEESEEEDVRFEDISDSEEEPEVNHNAERNFLPSDSSDDEEEQEYIKGLLKKNEKNHLDVLDDL